MSMKNCILVTFTIMILASCSDGNRIYEEHQDLSPDVEWLKKDVRIFEAEITDVSIPYNISLAFRYATGYPFDIAKIKVTHVNPDGEELSKTYDLQIRDKEGNYLGEAGYDIWDSEHLIEEGVLFNKAGKYTFKVEHDMPYDPLVMAMEVGVIIDKMKTE